jgi:hypothetical protein
MNLINYKLLNSKASFYYFIKDEIYIFDKEQNLKPIININELEKYLLIKKQIFINSLKTIKFGRFNFIKVFKIYKNKNFVYIKFINSENKICTFSSIENIENEFDFTPFIFINNKKTFLSDLQIEDFLKIGNILE